MEHVFLGIHFPAPRNYERVRVDDVNFNQNCAELIEKFRQITGNKDDVSLVYLGKVLEDSEPINRYNLRVGSTVHVLRKTVDDEPKPMKSFNELDVSRICSMYRSLNSGNFHVRTMKFSFCYDA
jgi:Ubiquitin family